MLIASIYRAVTSARNQLFDRGIFRSYSSSLPVICVGNLSVGGNGKTPLCIYIAQRLRFFGKHPVILMRGYGGQISGPHLVSSKDTVSDVGDEAVMLAQQFAGTVVVARSRVAGAKFIEQRAVGDTIILDDGFQHRWLRRSIDILAIDASSNESLETFLGGHLLPFGRFREDRDRALRRARVVVLNSRSANTVSAEMFARFRALMPANIQVFSSYLQHDQKVGDGAAVAVCGLANPSGFFESVRSCGFSQVVEKAFPDHHIFTSAELSDLFAHFTDYRFVCSCKDFVRLPEEVRKRFIVLSSKLVLNDPDGFDQHIRSLK